MTSFFNRSRIMVFCSDVIAFIPVIVFRLAILMVSNDLFAFFDGLGSRRRLPVSSVSTLIVQDGFLYGTDK